jgi:hypothetical protein
MNTAVAERDDTAEMHAKVNAVIARGDLKGLTDAEKNWHYLEVCRTVGVNPATRPFQYITLNQKLVLYPTKDCTDQLRKVNGINIEIVEYSTNEAGVLLVRVKATDKHGRHDEDYGAVSIKGLTGEFASNAFMKAITKAKRRVTLSISGLGFPEDPGDAEDGTPIRATTFTSAPLPKPHPAMSQDERSDMVEGTALTLEQLNQRVRAEAEKERAERAAAEPFVIPRPDETNTSWQRWWQTLMAYVRAAPDADAINNWTTKNAESMAALEKMDPEKHKTLVNQIKLAASNLGNEGS